MKTNDVVSTFALNAAEPVPARFTEWRHINKGGRYKVTGYSDGSGLLHGHKLVHYSRMGDSGSYTRLLLEWNSKMVPVK